MVSIQDLKRQLEREKTKFQIERGMTDKLKLRREILALKSKKFVSFRNKGIAFARSTHKVGTGIYGKGLFSIPKKKKDMTNLKRKFKVININGTQLIVPVKSKRGIGENIRRPLNIRNLRFINPQRDSKRIFRMPSSKPQRIQRFINTRRPINEEEFARFIP